MSMSKSTERLRDKALRARNTQSRILAATAPAAMSRCWGERLLLRMADNELRRMKRPGAKSLRVR